MYNLKNEVLNFVVANVGESGRFSAKNVLGNCSNTKLYGNVMSCRDAVQAKLIDIMEENFQCVGIDTSFIREDASFMKSLKSYISNVDSAKNLAIGCQIRGSVEERFFDDCKEWLNFFLQLTPDVVLSFNREATLEEKQVFFWDCVAYLNVSNRFNRFGFICNLFDAYLNSEFVEDRKKAYVLACDMLTA